MSVLKLFKWILSTTSMDKFFQSTLIGHSLFQNVDFPTHVSGNTLDLIITKDSYIFNNSLETHSMYLKISFNYQTI